MSLLPIIYSSILIFSGILVFVVILSYVSFKVKGDESYDFEEEEKVKHNISIPPLRQQRKEIAISDNTDVMQHKDQNREKLKSDSAREKSEYRNKTQKFDAKNIKVLYKEQDLFNRSKPRVHAARFSIVTDISEHLVKIDQDDFKSEAASFQTSHMIEVGSVDYLRYYENY